MRLVSTFLLSGCVAALAVCGCRTAVTGPGAGEGASTVFELAGCAVARRISGPQDRIAGPGSEGRVGDIVIENALVRFVVASQGRSAPAGCLLDAAVQNGRDRMRLLLPEVGSGRACAPVITAVNIADPGGPERTARVVASGHCIGSPRVLVHTAYELAPDVRRIRMETYVHNRGEEPLEDFHLADRICHGRASRFAEGLGLYPYPGSGRTAWFSFFDGDGAWGIFPAGGERMSARIGAGHAALCYSTVTIPPGGKVSYARYFAAARTSPSEIGELVHLSGFEPLGRLTVQAKQRRASIPVGGALMGIHRGGRAVSLLVLGPDGRGSCRLPTGRYILIGRSPGRAPVGPVPVYVQPGLERLLTLRFSKRAFVSVSVEEMVDGKPKPTSARITVYRGAQGTSASAPPVLQGPPFPTPDWGRVAFTDESGSVTIPLSPMSALNGAQYLIVASKGPLYNYQVARVRAVPGETCQAKLTLTRMVDAGDYVAVDFRQYAAASPGSALTLRERRLADMAEGLDGAVVAQEDPPKLARRGRDQRLPTLVAGSEFALAGCGSLSLYPLWPTSGRDRLDAGIAAATGRSPTELVAAARRRYPDAIVQLNCPLDVPESFFQRAGDSGNAAVPAQGAMGVEFDAIELLSGRDIDAARKVLPRWFELLNRGRKVFVTGGSGSEGLLWEQAGMARTYVHLPTSAASASALRLMRATESLRRTPNAFVSTGPFLRATVNGEPIGSVQTVKTGQVTVHLEVWGPPWVQAKTVKVYVNGEVTREVKVPAPKAALQLSRRLKLKLEGDCWLVIVVEGDQAMAPVYMGRGAAAALPFAVTNPFWIDTDGDGKVTPAP